MSTTVLDIPDLYEVIDGEIVETEPMSVEASGCASDIMAALVMYGHKTNLGKPYSETLIRMPAPFDRDRRPDVMFVSFRKWPKGRRLTRERSWDIVPDLCVEVVSPTDDAEDVRAKVDEYFSTGVPLVWVVYPQPALVDVYDSATTARTLRRTDTLTGGDILPGFELPLSELFPFEHVNGKA